MTRSTRFLLLALLLAASLASTGCNFRLLHVVIPDFETSQVIGVDVWQVDTPAPLEVGDITFGTIVTQDLGGGPIEMLEYFVPQADGSQTKLTAQVIRDPAQPGAIEVHLWFPKDTTVPGWYKVSSFNSHGSGPLSAAQTQLL